MLVPAGIGHAGALPRISMMPFFFTVRINKVLRRSWILPAVHHDLSKTPREVIF
jgi:hypothetical protein